MKRYIAVLALVACVMVSPSITHAAWYNPFSWFSKPAPAIVIPAPVEEIEAPITPTVAPTAPVTITKTITVSDPKDQKLISDLQAQLVLAQAEIARLHSMTDDLATQITKLKSAGGVPIQIVNPPKTKDQLAAQYEIEHPKPNQKEAKYRGLTSNDPTFSHDLMEYTTAEKAWINQQLANQ